jgi:hypothetical protein
MKVRFSRHARRRAKLYRIPESSVEAVVTRESLAQGQHEFVVDVPERRYPLKIIVVVEDDVATVITNYPLKKAAAK